MRRRRWSRWCRRSRGCCWTCRSPPQPPPRFHGPLGWAARSASTPGPGTGQRSAPGIPLALRHNHSLLTRNSTTVVFPSKQFLCADNIYNYTHTIHTINSFLFRLLFSISFLSVLFFYFLFFFLYLSLLYFFLLFLFFSFFLLFLIYFSCLLSTFVLHVLNARVSKFSFLYFCLSLSFRSFFVCFFLSNRIKKISLLTTDRKQK